MPKEDQKRNCSPRAHDNEGSRARKVRVGGNAHQDTEVVQGRPIEPRSRPVHEDSGGIQDALRYTPTLERRGEGPSDTPLESLRDVLRLSEHNAGVRYADLIDDGLQERGPSPTRLDEGDLGGRSRDGEGDARDAGAAAEIGYVSRGHVRGAGKSI